MTDAAPLERIQCQWCQSMNEKTATACRACGAPLDIHQSGQRVGLARGPHHDADRDPLQRRCSHQVEAGNRAYGQKINLGPGDSIFFEHHVMLWKDVNVPLSVLQLSSVPRRHFVGMPFIIRVATRPGRIAFSRDATGELVVPRCIPAWSWTSREHAFLLSSHQIGYLAFIAGNRAIFSSAARIVCTPDRFVTTSTSGLLILHGYGSVFRTPPRRR